MEEKNNKILYALLVGLVVITGIVNFIAIKAINNESPSVEEIQTVVKEEVAKIPAPVVNLPPQTNAGEQPISNEKVDKLCELTDGCEFYKADSADETAALNELNSKITTTGRDFVKAFSALVGIDKEYLVISSIEKGFNGETKVVAYTKEDKKKDNWEVSTLVKVKYYDKDREDSKVQTKYIVVKSVLDEGEYDSMTLTEVNRTFTFG